jgi:restriction system protein
MARKREEGIFEIVATLPWWSSVVAAFLVYVFLRSMLPTLVGSSAILKGIAHYLQPNAWIFACLFLFPFPAALIGILRRRKLLDSQTGIASIRCMSWRNFERVVGESFRRQGHGVEERADGATVGGADLVLRKNGKTTVVRCNSWRNARVKVRPVRELFRAMHADKADAAIFVSSGSYTAAAKQFTEDKPIRLIGGAELARMIAALQEERRLERIPGRGFAPSRQQFVFGKVCPICGEAMVKRIATKGPSSGSSFWGCSRFPTCRGTLPEVSLEGRRLPPARHAANRSRPIAGQIVKVHSSLSRRSGRCLATKRAIARVSVSGEPMPPTPRHLPRTVPTPTREVGAGVPPRKQLA